MGTTFFLFLFYFLFLFSKWLLTSIVNKMKFMILNAHEDMQLFSQHRVCNYVGPMFQQSW